jgi:hypothetical protein
MRLFKRCLIGRFTDTVYVQSDAVAYSNMTFPRRAKALEIPRKDLWLQLARALGGLAETIATIVKIRTSVGRSTGDLM